MGVPKRASFANLICAITFAESSVNIEEVESALEDIFGSIDARSGTYCFDSFTDYYEPEMGKNLLKYFVSFMDLVDRSLLADFKLKTNELEEEFGLVDGGVIKRRVNLDPGYIAEAQLVLASTKGYAHRIYLRDGIHAEVTLIFKKGEFVPLEWTYPDYRQISVRNFFKAVRASYLEKLRKWRAREKL